ncbi:hypothetical protein MNB_SV-15-1025 [hydrothermal vent metagenome]|uniref:Uncharacterized protein n=1 Tax=hydrothermal vent metagenome TaxID=652676 RepID=A0A1W1ELK7_9ZZZZ
MNSDKKERGITIMMIISIISVMFAIISMALIQTYINKQIYYKSLELSRIQKEYDILKVEERALTHTINQLRYKNLVLDMIRH